MDKFEIGFMEMKTPQSIEEILKFGKGLLENNGKVFHQVFMEKKVRNKIIAGVFVVKYGDGKDKEDVNRHIHITVKKFKAEKVFMLMEAWYRPLSLGKEIFIRPTSHVDRKECLVINEFNKDLTTETFRLPFVKDKNKIIYGKLHDMKGAETVWNPFLEQEGVEEKFDNWEETVKEEFFKNKSKEFSKKYFPKFKECKTDEERNVIILEMMDEMKEEKKKQMSKVRQSDT